MHFIKDEEDPAGIVATLGAGSCPGSYLVLSHATGDFHSPGDVTRAAAVYSNATAAFVPRPLEQVAGFFDGFWGRRTFHIDWPATPTARERRQQCYQPG